MKKWTWFIVVIVLTAAACWLIYHYYNKQTSSANIESEPTQTATTTAVIKPVTENRKIPPSAIIGLWTDGQVNYDNIEFKNDSIIYHQFKNAYPFFLNGDSIKIEMNDMTLKGKLVLLNDTLKIISEDGGMILWRMKKKG
jgi:hypothetical protein